MKAIQSHACSTIHLCACLCSDAAHEGGHEARQPADVGRRRETEPTKWLDADWLVGCSCCVQAYRIKYTPHPHVGDKW